MAAKTSASTAFNSFFNSFNQQQSNNNNNATKQMDMNNNLNEPSDLHFKMSKKIAQLTKVVYALNSKNDESENLVANLKAQYEEEKEQIFLETNRKLEEFKMRLMANNNTNERILELESKLKDLQNQKEKALRDLESFKMRTIENEENLVITHRQEIIRMTNLLEDLKGEHEKQIQKFDSITNKYNIDKQNLIEDLKQKHRNELESLKQSFNSNKDTFSVEKSKLEEKHASDMLKLRADIDALNSKLMHEKLEHEQNITKLKTFHEKELDAHKQNSTKEFTQLIENLKIQLEQANKDKVSAEKEHNKRYEKKLEEIVGKEDEIKSLNDKLILCKNDLETSNINVANLNSKFDELKIENSSNLSKISVLEYDNNSLKEKLAQFEKSLMQKSSEITQLEVSSMQKSSILSDLKRELNLNKERLIQLESDRKNLEREYHSENERNNQVINSLEKQLALLTSEKDSQKSEFESKILALNDINQKQTEKLITELQIEKQELINEYDSKLSTEKALFDERILTLERDLNRDFNAENQKLILERNELRVQLEKLMDELKSKTKNYESELKSLTESLNMHETNVSKLTKENNELIDSNSFIQNDYNLMKQTSKEQHSKIEKLTKEIDELKFLLESTSKDSQYELKVKLDILNKELNAKWAETLRIECDTLRKELQLTKDEENRLEIERLNNLKEQEIKNLKSIWQTKTNELLEEISLLKKELNEKEHKSNEKFEKIINNLENENRTLNEQIKTLNVDFKSQMDELKSQINNETRIQIDNIIKENEAKISELKTRHLEDLKASTIAQKAALASFKSSMETSKNLEIEMLNEAHNKKIEMIKYDADQQHYAEMDKVRHENEQEMFKLRVELERSIEISKQKERELELKTDEFESELHMKQKFNDKLNDELRGFKLLNSELKEEIDFKIKEIKEIRNNAQLEIKNKEKILQQKKDEELNRVNSEHMKQKQLLVNEFKEAHEILKNKISDTEMALREMHERYVNRESREEDLQIIEMLKRTINERDDLLRKLNEEKKYFQMELVNRENNFNKMFNVMPNVGTINPLVANTKIKTKSMVPTMGKSSPQTFGKLDPIPGIGSPLHDLTLNPNKPLPKKFLS